MSNYIKSKEKVLESFRNEVANNPFWKLFKIGVKQSVQQNLVTTAAGESQRMFEEFMNNVGFDEIYKLQMFRNDGGKKKQAQQFIMPQAEFVFCLERSPNAALPPVISGVTGNVSNPQPQMVNPYMVNPSQQIGLSDHIQLISAKAKAESDCEYYKQVITDQARTIVELERENADLDAEVEELIEKVNELEEALESEAEGEEGAIKGTPDTMESVVAGLLKDHGGVIIENLVSRGGIKGAEDITFEDTDKPGETDKKTVSGITDSTFESVTIEQLNNEMLLLNKNWKKHLYKMVLIGKQKPATFKMFMLRLENY